MSNVNLGRMLLAVPLFFGSVIGMAGYSIVRDWASESTALIITGVLILAGGAVMVASAVWLLGSRGRQGLPLWSGGLASVVTAIVITASTLSHVLPCASPA